MKLPDAPRKALREGAGLPVVEPLASYVMHQAENGESTPPNETITQVRERLDDWLTTREERIHERLDNARDGPLQHRIRNHVENLIHKNRNRLAHIQHETQNNETMPWETLQTAFNLLHETQNDLRDTEQAAHSLQEINQLLDGLPANAIDGKTLDRTAQKEALIATNDDPKQWAQGARALEETYREHAGQALRQLARTELDQPQPPKERPKPRSTPPTPKPQQPPPPPDPDDDETDPAGLNRLEHSRNKATTAFTEEQANTLRHATLWAPIATEHPTLHDPQALLEHAHDNEIDLVDIELPRILAIPPHKSPKRLHRQLADQAHTITKRSPEQSARETFLDYVTGKLPQRYRENRLGRGLVQSIAITLTQDEPWTPTPDERTVTIQHILQRELEQNPVVNLHDLTQRLLGSDNPEIVNEAAKRLTSQHDHIHKTPDGTLIALTFDRNSPDALYATRRRLAAHVGQKKANELIETYVREATHHE